MAIFGAWVNGFIGVAGVNLSDHAREITLETSVAELPSNVHGTQTATVRAGLNSWTINVTFLQDFAAAKVDATMASVNGPLQTPFGVEVGPDTVASISTTNPRYSGLAILASYRPFGGQHGVLMEANCTFRCASDLTRRTA
jgi:hypothetical protein